MRGGAVRDCSKIMRPLAWSLDAGSWRAAAWRNVMAVVAVFMFCGAAQHATAQQGAGPSPDRDTLQKQLEASRDELRRKLEQESDLKSAVATLAAEREQLNQDLIRTAAEIQRSETELTQLEGDLAEREAREQLIRGSLSIQHRKIARLLAAMQRMGRNPPPVIVTRREDALTMVRSAMLLAHAVPELKVEADRLRTQLTALETVTKEIRQNRDDLKSKSIELATQEGSLEDKLAAKRRSLTVQQAELKAVQDEAARIRRESRSLEDLIAGLDKVVGRTTGLNAYNRKLAAKDLADKIGASEPERKPAAPSQPEPNRQVALNTRPPEAAPRDPLPPVTRPQASLAPDGTRVERRADRLTPAVRFSRARGTLPLPAAGRTVMGFGAKTKLGRQSQGIVIETRANARITSPTDGWVVYAGPFRSYGQLLIINAGDGYHILLAGMSRIDVQLGQFVLASEPIGAMGASPTSSESASRPVLYVEFRKKGRPVDPDPWWAKGQRIAQR